MKQSLSLLLVFALVLSLFAGCGSQTAPETKPVTPVETEATPAATEDQALMETCVREYMGDVTGTVIILG